MITAKSYLLNSLVTALLLTIFVEPALANEYDTTDSPLIIKEQARSLLNQMSLDLDEEIQACRIDDPDCPTCAL